ncbi:hypothetical protein E2C01_092237 [Portunus trituberculatus]|uniref:Uncharacterized protein n=1 Tax=Portunus trituberculatus TaxID=210409 RepID=A0A5B7JX81_PORTR|nr:hypothetical protein [Portunus trituberculatus]
MIQYKTGMLVMTRAPHPYPTPSSPTSLSSPSSIRTWYGHWLR